MTPLLKPLAALTTAAGRTLTGTASKVKGKYKAFNETYRVVVK